MLKKSRISFDEWLRAIHAEPPRTPWDDLVDELLPVRSGEGVVHITYAMEDDWETHAVFTGEVEPRYVGDMKRRKDKLKVGMFLFEGPCIVCETVILPGGKKRIRVFFFAAGLHRGDHEHACI